MTVAGGHLMSVTFLRAAQHRPITVDLDHRTCVGRFANHSETYRIFPNLAERSFSRHVKCRRRDTRFPANITPHLHISDRSETWFSPARRTDAKTDTTKTKTSPFISELNPSVCFHRVTAAAPCCFVSTVL